MLTLTCNYKQFKLYCMSPLAVYPFWPPQRTPTSNFWQIKEMLQSPTLSEYRKRSELYGMPFDRYFEFVRWLITCGEGRSLIDLLPNQDKVFGQIVKELTGDEECKLEFETETWNRLIPIAFQLTKENVAPYKVLLPTRSDIALFFACVTRAGGITLPKTSWRSEFALHPLLQNSDYDPKLVAVIDGYELDAIWQDCFEQLQLPLARKKQWQVSMRILYPEPKVRRELFSRLSCTLDRDVALESVLRAERAWIISELKREITRLYPQVKESLKRYFEYPDGNLRGYFGILPHIRKVQKEQALACKCTDSSDWPIALVQTLYALKATLPAHEQDIFQENLADFAPVGCDDALELWLRDCPESFMPQLSNSYYRPLEQLLLTREIIAQIQNWGQGVDPAQLWSRHCKGVPTSKWYALVCNALLSEAQKVALFNHLFGNELASSKNFEKIFFQVKGFREQAVNRWFHNPENFRVQVARTMGCSSLTLRARGGAANTNSIRLEALIKHWKPPQEPSPLARALEEAREHAQYTTPQKVDDLFAAIVPHEARILGRTVIVPREGGLYDAYKIQKESELPPKLFAECYAMQRLVSMKLPWEIPNAIRVVETRDLPEWVVEAVTRSGVALVLDRPPAVLHYRASEEYFIYLNDPTLSDEQFLIGRRKFLEGGAKMVQSGIYPVWTNMFHNEEQARHYLTLIDLLRGTHIGAGRLDAVTKGFRTPNIRLSGGADFDDRYLESELVQDPGLKSEDIEERPCPAWKLRANAIAELMLVDACIILTRWNGQNKINYKNEALATELARMVQEAAVTICTTYSGCQKEVATNFFHNSGINYQQLAKQLLWSFQNNQEGYVGDLSQEEPDLSHIFPNIPVDAKEAKNTQNFTPNGYMKNGVDLDIGGFNSPLAWVEMEKLWHILPLMAMNLEAAGSA